MNNIEKKYKEDCKKFEAEEKSWIKWAKKRINKAIKNIKHKAKNEKK